MNLVTGGRMVKECKQCNQEFTTAANHPYQIICGSIKFKTGCVWENRKIYTRNWIKTKYDPFNKDKYNKHRKICHSKK
jgi:hypothetical protein